MLVCVLVSSACGGGEPAPDDRATVSAPRVAHPLEADWVRGYCTQVGRVSSLPVLCAGERPAGAGPTRNADVLRPNHDGYVFEVVADGRHWVFGASSARATLRGYRPWRRLGETSVRSRSGSWLQMSEASGIHAGHLALTWLEGRWRYVVSVHQSASATIKAAIRAAAEDMRPT